MSNSGLTVFAAVRASKSFLNSEPLSESIANLELSFRGSETPSINASSTLAVWIVCLVGIATAKAMGQS